MIEVGELTVRQKEAGGAVADSVKVLGAVSPLGRRQIVLLIHGYANDQPAASASFDACIANLVELPVAASSELPSPIFKFYWPGDTRLRWFSALSYPWEITPATDAAARLASFLAGLAGPAGGPMQVHLIAHSLGSRVLLEALSRFRLLPRGPVIIRSVSLMAAAVPVRKVEDPRDLMYAALEPDRLQALYSTSDSTLSFWFPIGETLAGEGLFPEAVGRFGHPDGIWTQSQEMARYKHGDYWPKPETAPFLAGLLDVPVAPLPTQNVIDDRPGPEERSLKSATVGARRLLTRSIDVRR